MLTVCDLKRDRAMEKAPETAGPSGLNASYQGEDLVFIVGSPRSGTTYLQRLLASHPNVKTGQESDLFDNYIGPLLSTWDKYLNEQLGRGGVGLACYFNEDEFLKIVKDFLMQLLRPMLSQLGPGQLFLEKTPSHALYMDEMHLMLPKARFIHIVRDARDVVASLLAASKSWGMKWAPGVPSRATGLWLEHVEAVEESKARIPYHQFREVKYEELKRFPSRCLRELAEYIDLDWSDAQIDEAVEENSYDSLRNGGGTPIPKAGEFGRITGHVVKEPDGFVRRSMPGGWRKDLSFRAKIAVWRMARKKMAQYGYEWPFPW